MNRRDFLRRASMIAAGAVAADQLELLDRLGWVRRFFPGFGSGAVVAPYAWNSTTLEWDKLLRDAYGESPMAALINLNTPFVKRLRAPASLYQAIVPGHYIKVVRG